MWSQEYKPGYYLQGYCINKLVTVLYSPSGYGYDLKKECKSLHAAKCFVAKHIKERKKQNV